MSVQFTIGAIGVALVSTTALGGITITQGSSAPTYSSTLTFDEPGAPVGVGLAPNSWTPWGVADLQAGDSNQVVTDVTGTPGYGWLGTGNSFYGNFGVVLTRDSDATEFSTQFWDPSGPPSFFGGGAVAFVFDDGVELGFFSFEPAWGGVGDEWINVTTDGGTVFDEIRILGYGFGPTSYIDNASWNAVPVPGAAALLGVAGLIGTRRRRA